MTKPLDPTAIASLLKQDDKKEAEKKTSAIRRKHFPTEPRDFDTWFKLPVRFAVCTNPKCLDPRVSRETTGNTMVAEINQGEICRYCFLAGVNKPTV